MKIVCEYQKKISVPCGRSAHIECILHFKKKGFVVYDLTYCFDVTSNEPGVKKKIVQ